jgi:hypothetical protein
MSEKRQDKDGKRIFIGDSLTTTHLKSEIDRVPERRTFTTAHLQKAVQQQNPPETPSNGDGATEKEGK